MNMRAAGAASLRGQRRGHVEQGRPIHQPQHRQQQDRAAQRHPHHRGEPVGDEPSHRLGIVAPARTRQRGHQPVADAEVRHREQRAERAQRHPHAIAFGAQIMQRPRHRHQQCQDGNQLGDQRSRDQSAGFAARAGPRRGARALAPRFRSVAASVIATAQRHDGAEGYGRPACDRRRLLQPHSAGSTSPPALAMVCDTADTRSCLHLAQRAAICRRAWPRNSGAAGGSCALNECRVTMQTDHALSLRRSPRSGRVRSAHAVAGIAEGRRALRE